MKLLTPPSHFPRKKQCVGMVSVTQVSEVGCKNCAINCAIKSVGVFLWLVFVANGPFYIKAGVDLFARVENIQRIADVFHLRKQRECFFVEHF